jgi:hypothetical protein
MLLTNSGSSDRDHCERVATNPEIKNLSLSLLQTVRIRTVTGLRSVTLSMYVEVKQAVHKDISDYKWLQAILLNMCAYLCMHTCVCVFLVLRG